MSLYYGDADIQPMLNDLGGVLVTVGASSANCHVSIADEKLLAAEGVTFTGREVAVVARTKAFTGVLTEGATVTVAAGDYGGTYKLILAHQLRDGALTGMLLARTV